MMKISQTIQLPRIITISAALLVVVGVFLLSRTVQAESVTDHAGQHVLSIYDGGEERGILTKADTVGEALEKAGIEIGENDITEPSLDHELVAGNYNVNIYRARSVLVIDGDKRTKVMTAYQTGDQIAKQVGIELHDNDRADLRVSTKSLLNDSALERLVIDRATAVNFVLYGEKATVYTHQKTVGDFLKSRDITLQENDVLSVKKSTEIKAGMTIELWRNGEQVVTEEESVDFPVKRIEDADRKVGYKKIETPGAKGKKMVTYKVVMKNGKELSRKEIKSVIVKEPKQQVVIVGTKPSFSGDFAAALAKLRSCEGGYDSWNPAGPYYGAYQFGQGTWATVADPALYGDASPAVQDQAARDLYERRGWQPWPVCGASLPDIYR